MPPILHSSATQLSSPRCAPTHALAVLPAILPVLRRSAAVPKEHAGVLLLGHLVPRGCQPLLHLLDRPGAGNAVEPAVAVDREHVHLRLVGSWGVEGWLVGGLVVSEVGLQLMEDGPTPAPHVSYLLNGRFGTRHPGPPLLQEPCSKPQIKAPLEHVTPMTKAACHLATPQKHHAVLHTLAAPNVHVQLAHVWRLGGPLPGNPLNPGLRLTEAIPLLTPMISPRKPLPGGCLSLGPGRQSFLLAQSARMAGKR